MKKILLTFFIYFCFFSYTFALEDIKIISRDEWWAYESYRYLDSDEWKSIIKKRDEANKAWKEKYENMTDEQKKKIKEDEEKESKKQKEINNYFSNNFAEDNKLVEVIYEENWHKLAWPIQKTNYIKWIIIHHTEWSYESSLDWIKKIYKFHAINREWWDIWYNYIIGYDWEIFEWRSWWDYVVWAHALYNNRSTVWISIMWNYDEDELNEKQKESLNKLVKYLLEKYGINTNSIFDYHHKCVWPDCKFPIITKEESIIVGHKDAWNTSCPWENVYKLLDSLNEQNRSFSKDFAFVPYKNNLVKKEKQMDLTKIDYNKLLDVLVLLEERLDKTNNSNYKKLKEQIVKELNVRNVADNKETLIKSELTIDDTQKIKVKLSYPDNDFVSISSWYKVYNIKRDWEYLFVNWKRKKAFLIESDKDSYVEISSWDRYPAWDNEKKYNDNKFRWDIIVYVKNEKLYIVNHVLLVDYLKWLWEISNSENREKIKTIIVAARTYAYWYTTKDRKFSWEFYDASDDPDVFQKYLWYGLELRSPNINQIVDETKWQMITYNWDLIKPWYFSSSSWKTLSFKDYCNANDNDKYFCDKESKNYPFLSSVKDPWWIGKVEAWHWVGISWVWTSYFAERWWNYEMIISYFLRGTKVESI